MKGRIAGKMRNAKSAKASPVLPVGQASAREKKVASPHFPLSVGVRFIEPVFSGRINPLPTKDLKLKTDNQNTIFNEGGKMEKEFILNQTQLTKEGYVIVSSYFLDYCVEILGTGPGMLYIQLLNYCHKGKDLAWPTLATLGRKMQFTPKSITKFHQILLKHGLIKKISKGRTASGNYRRNIYQVIPIHMVKNTLSKGNIFPHIEEKITH